MTTVSLTEPVGDMDAPLKFTAGLVLGIPLDAELRHLCSMDTLRIKVRYPDQQVHLLVPKCTDLRPMEDGTTRLLTTVLVSHQVWTEACAVDVSLALDLTAQEGGFGPGATRKARPSELDPYVIELCKPTKVYVSPKPIKKAI